MSNFRKIGSKIDQLFPSFTPIKVKKADQARLPARVRAQNFLKSTLATPAGKEINVLATGSILDVNTIKSPYWRNHFSPISNSCSLIKILPQPRTKRRTNV